MTHDDIKEKVRSILNEHGGDDTIGIATDRVLLDDYIESAIPDAVVMLASKGYRVNVKKAMVSDHGDEVAIGDFLSFIEAYSGMWNKRVTHLTPTDSPEFIMSLNEFTKPGPNSPIVWWDEIRNDLCAAPWEDDEKVTFVFNARYDGVSFKAEQKEATAVCYMAAALTLGMFGDDAGKQRLSDISMNMLQ